MTSISTSTKEYHGVQEIHLRLAGCLDADGVLALRPDIEAAASADAERLIVDLSDVAAIDGSGVGAISHMFRRATAAGREFALRGAAGQPLAVLQDLGLAAMFGLPAPRRARPAFGGVFGGLAQAFGV